MSAFDANGRDLTPTANDTAVRRLGEGGIDASTASKSADSQVRNLDDLLDGIKQTDYLSSFYSDSKKEVWLRKWQILIGTDKEDGGPSGTANSAINRAAEKSGVETVIKKTSTIDVSNLHCTFTVRNPLFGQKQCALQIFNLNRKSEFQVLHGQHLSIYAGYQNSKNVEGSESKYGLIFSGRILQTFTNRNAGTDYVTEVIAIEGGIVSNTKLKATMAAGGSMRDLSDTITAEVRRQGVDDFSMSLPEDTDGTIMNENTKLPRGKVLYGKTSRYLRQLGKMTDSFPQISSSDEVRFVQFRNGRNLRGQTMDEVQREKNYTAEDGSKSVGALVLTKDSGLIDTPVYTDQGIRVTALLDARLEIGRMVKIQNRYIRRQAVQYNPSSGLGSVNQYLNFDKYGEYKIQSITHSGDTHSNTWRTEFIGWSAAHRLTGNQMM